MTNGYLVHTISMGRGGSLRIDDGAGMRVHLCEGDLWITQAGDTRDYFVAAGGSFRIGSDGATLLYAMHEGHLTLTAPMPDNYARLISSTPAGADATTVLYDAARQHRNWFGRLRYRQRFLKPVR